MNYDNGYNLSWIDNTWYLQVQKRKRKSRKISGLLELFNISWDLPLNHKAPQWLDIIG